ncbi:hypothetical protein ABT218_28655 [Streptomyces sp. NPDC001455]|uniref:hypothetical protein n=1 Tax=Streptomyces sp. NPDC001455 TaxID=3154518 RepID=UPI00332317AB
MNSSTPFLVPYHCLISVQARGGFFTATRVFDMDVSHPDATRAELFRIMRAVAVEQLGHGDFAILFFSAELNRLGER